MPEHDLALTLTPEFSSVDRARAAIQEYCRGAFGAALSEDLFGDFTIAFNEAMNNAVEHSGAPAIDIVVAAQGPEVVFRMATEGAPFDPTAGSAMPDLDAPAPLPEGGFGLAIIRELVDRMEYEYRDGRNILTVVKKIHQ